MKLVCNFKIQVVEIAVLVVVDPVAVAPVVVAHVLPVSPTIQKARQMENLPSS